METLVSVLVGGLALLMLAVVMASATHMVSDSKDKMNEYYADSNALALAAGTSTVEGTVALEDASGNPVSLSGDGSAVSVDVVYEEGKVAGEPVVSYKTKDGS